MGAGTGVPAFEGQLSDWRTFRARLVEGEQSSTLRVPSTFKEGEWAHFLHKVEEGCCLIAEPTYIWPRSFAHLQHAVVLITDLNDVGVKGLLLTRPTNYFVGDQISVLGRVGRECVFCYPAFGSEIRIPCNMVGTY